MSSVSTSGSISGTTRYDPIIGTLDVLTEVMNKGYVLSNLSYEEEEVQKVVTLVTLKLNTESSVSKSSELACSFFKSISRCFCPNETEMPNKLQFKLQGKYECSEIMNGKRFSETTPLVGNS